MEIESWLEDLRVSVGDVKNHVRSCEGQLKNESSTSKERRQVYNILIDVESQLSTVVLSLKKILSTINIHRAVVSECG